MSIPTDNSPIPEHDSLSDSDWLDIASTDRESDDNDSICSSRETDHEHHSRSRSRQSSLSYGSSRDGDVEGWEGLIDDSADEGTPDDVLAPNPHVPPLSPPSDLHDIDHSEETSPEELRVKEGLDQSMVSTLSSSRSSSLHASTVHNSSRDLRLSFPDPITSSCREHLSTSYEEVQPTSEHALLPTDLDNRLDSEQVEDDEMLSASQVLSTPPEEADVMLVPPPCGPELKVFLYGSSVALKWSLIERLLEKVAHGAGLSIASDCDISQGQLHRLTIVGHSEHDRAFPRVITIIDKTLQPQETIDDPSLMDFSGVHPLAVIFMPACPPRLPEHVLYLPVLPPAMYSIEIPEFTDVVSAQCTWGTFNIPDRRLLRITAPTEPVVVNEQTIEALDTLHAYRAFSRLWSSDNNVSKGTMGSTNALTIIAILSLILGVIVRAAIPAPQSITSTLVSFNATCTSGSLWQLLRPAPHRERITPSATADSSIVTMPSSMKDFSLSIFSAESTSIALSLAIPTNFRRTTPPVSSERPRISKDLVVQPSHSVLPVDNRPKALSVIPETTSTLSLYPGPASTSNVVSTLAHQSIPGVIREYAPIISAVVNKDIQDILDALDALVQAITRQAQIILKQTTSFISESATHLEKSMESLETVKDTFVKRNERARKRAKEIKEQGTKWLYDASELFTTGAQFSRGMAKEMAEGFATKAQSASQRARGRAKEMAEEIQEFLNEQDRFDAFGMITWDLQAKRWDKWVEKRSNKGKKGKTCKPSKRQLKSAIFG